MFGSDVLDVGIAMSLLFLMMSLIATAVREAIEGYMKSRSTDLEKGLREMLDDREKGNFSGMVGQLYNHPLISSLYQGTLEDAKKKGLPSYIPSKTFVSALLDIVLSSTPPAKAAPGDPAAPKVDADHSQGKVALPQAARDNLTIEALKSNADNLPPRLRSIMLSAIDDAQNDINNVRKNLEGWFDSTMDRVSGWYRRRTQTVLFGIGIAAAVVLNVDSITIASRLTNDKTLRAAIVETARPHSTPGAQGTVLGPTTTKSYEQISTELASIGYPIGWKESLPEPQMCTPKCTFSATALFKAIVGWFVTAFAIMLGAPFWFDVLNRFMVVRSTVKPSEKSPNEASKDSSAPTPSLKLIMASAGDAAPTQPAAAETGSKS
jgi:hypothetical protein